MKTQLNKRARRRLTSAFPVLGNPANRNRAVPLTYDQFRYGLANAVDEDEARHLYETYSVPAAGKPLFQAAANLNPVDRGQGRHLEPRSRPAADHLTGRGHALTIDKGWHEVADTALTFLERTLGS